MVVISQSGETADTLAALRLAKKQGIKTLAIVNVAGSTIAREADIVLYTYAGPEIAVASTKAYSVQTGVLYLLAIRIALEKGRIGESQAAAYVENLQKAIEMTSDALKTDEKAKELSTILKHVEDLFFIGRGADFPLCREGSLKLKEISYIHSEAYEAGELKHGTISLITDGVPVIAVATQSALLPKIGERKVRVSGPERAAALCGPRHTWRKVFQPWFPQTHQGRYGRIWGTSWRRPGI